MAIEKTASGNFSVDYWGPVCHCDKKPDKHRHRYLKTFPTHKAAVSYAKEMVDKVDKGTFIPPSSKTVGEVASEWYRKRVDAGTYRRSTLQAWRNHIQNFIVPSLGDTLVRSVDVETVERCAEEWATKVSAKSSNKVLTTLTSIMGLGKRFKLATANPAAEATRLKVPTEEEDGRVDPSRVYSKSELNRLIAATELGSQDRLLIMTLSFLGLRIGELMGLTWPAIDLKAGQLQVKHSLADTERGLEPALQAPKTPSSRRSLRLPKELLAEFRSWKLKCPLTTRQLVFVVNGGRAYTRKLVSEVLDRAIVKAGVPRLTPHGLRHTFASLMLLDNKTATEVSAYLGHRDPSITLQVYAHFVKEETGAMQDFATSILGS